MFRQYCTGSVAINQLYLGNSHRSLEAHHNKSLIGLLFFLLHCFCPNSSGHSSGQISNKFANDLNSWMINSQLFSPYFNFSP